MIRSKLACAVPAFAVLLACGPTFAQAALLATSAPAKSAGVTGTAAVQPAAATPAAATPQAETPKSEAPKPEASKSEASKPAVVDSLQILERAVAKDSTKFDNLYRLGVMYLDRDRVNEATRVLLKAKQLKPKNHRVMVNLGAAFDAAGQPATAQIYYRQALQLAPNDSVATCRLASSLYAQANYSEAMKLLRGMIDESKNRGAYCAYFTLGVAFADAGIYRDAIRMWRKVIEIAPNSPEANSAKESIDVLQKFVNK